MYAMIRHYRMHAGSMDDLMHKVDTEFADRLQESLGILGYQAIATGGATLMTVTLFATEDELRAAEPMADQVRQALAEFKVELIEGLSGAVRVARGSQQLLHPIHAGR